MEAWLASHKIEAVARPQWEAPPETETERDEADADAERVRAARGQIADSHRRRMHELVDTIAARDLEMAIAFLEFLRERRHTAKPRVRTEETTRRDAGQSAPEDGVLLSDDD